MRNEVQLIAYVDRLSGGGFEALRRLLAGPLHGLFGGVHVLPFFERIDGADAGFDPIDHTRVDARLGDWDDVRRLAAEVPMMADVIVNHVSAESPQFKDYARRGAASRYAGMFLGLDSVFPHGARERDLTAIYRPRPGLPFSTRTLATGEKRVLWTTFTPEQLDIDVHHPEGRAYLLGILDTFAANGIGMVRLDAVGYAVKRAGTSCFMLPETFAFVDAFAAEARARGIEVLVEIHSYFRRQVEIAARVDWVYDFALPPLVLHALMFGTSRYLRAWLEVRPANALTVLDTHDGIGVIDVGADAADPAAHPGLMPPAEIDRLVERIHANTGGESRRATGAAASNLDLYQVNSTFYDALGRNDRAYLAARALQFFVPGRPQVYYVGLLAGGNDMDLLARTGVGRDINRHRYGPGEVEAALARPVVQELCALIRLRNTHPAFAGRCSVEEGGEDRLVLAWREGRHVARLEVDFGRADFAVEASDP